MTSVNLQQWIQHPETLNRDTLYELRNQLARYPYFQSLRLLYLKNLYILHDINFGAELRKAVLYIADRRKLFHLIEGERFAVESQKKGLPLSEVLKDEPTVDRTLALIDAFLSTAPEEVTSQTSFDYSMDYTAYLLEETPVVDEPAEAMPKLKGHELIDNFIEKSETDPVVYLKPLKEEEKAKAASSAETNETGRTDETTETNTVEEEDDSCFTETLAKIYVKQQRYSKALEIIKKLSLKYPKKNAYFADQIRFLEKLIINANSKYLKMYLLFVILMVIAALLMCFIVLIQNSKGGGLASGFSSSNAIMGVRKTTDFLEKATWGLAIFMVVMSIATAYVVPRSAVAKDAVLEQAQKEQQTNPYNLPAGTAAPQTEAPATNAPATETPAPAAETPAPAAE